MYAMTTALSAFSARATRGRRAVLVAYSALVALAILGLSHLIISATPDGDLAQASTLGLADMLSVMALGTALFVVAPAMIAAHVAEERRQGTLDLLRTAPISATALTAGFLFGAPGSLYLLCVGPMAIHVAAGLLGVYPIAYLPITLLLFGFGALATMLFAVVVSAAVSREGGGVSPLLVTGGLAVAALITTSMSSYPDSMPWAFLHPAGGLAFVYDCFPGVYRDLFIRPWQREQIMQGPLSALLCIQPVFIVALYAAASGLLMSAARRLLSSDPPSKLEKPTAIALFGLAAIAVLVPLRIIVKPSEFETGTFYGMAFTLCMPYLACVLAVTPSATGRRIGARAFSAVGAPHLTALTLAALGLGLMGLFYGSSITTALSWETPRALAFIALALTLPIYALYAATRISTVAGRLAFWAFVGVHFMMQIPAIVGVTESLDGVPHVLARVGVAFGIALPVFVAWRQRVADRALVRS
jgi:hypothetical protein